MNSRQTLALLAITIGIHGPSHAYPVVQIAACVKQQAINCASGITDLILEGARFDHPLNRGSYDQILDYDAPYLPGTPLAVKSASMAQPVAAGSKAPVAAPTVATVALVGLALVALGLSRRTRSVHIQVR